MPWTEIVIIAVKGLAVHKVRTLLSMLGIIFGISSVVAMLSIGEGARHDIDQQVAALGVRTVRIVEPEGRKPDETKRVRTRSAGLTREEADVFRTRVPGLVGVAPLRVRKMTVRVGHRRADAAVTGTTPDYLAVGTERVARGRFLLPADEADAARVAVTSALVAHELFGDADPIGREIRIEHELYRVVGVLASRGPLGGDGAVRGIRDMTRRVFVPLRAMLHRMTRNPLRAEIDEIVCKVDDVARLGPTVDAADAFFRTAHGGVRDFEVLIALDLVAQRQRAQQIFDIVMGSIASISLLVGGIGIMNIMLANISERRREIGIRRAVGARRRDVLRQFLVEAAAICVIGGIIGVLLGVLLAGGISAFAEWKTLISWHGIVLSLIVSVVVGLLFGTYPAWKAARMDPIEALSLE